MESLNWSLDSVTRFHIMWHNIASPCRRNTSVVPSQLCGLEVVLAGGHLSSPMSFRM